MQELDFNLLLALNVLLREQSVTVAAEKMHLSVPAMSRTLLRIRKMMGDPILVRAGMHLVPTPKAIEIQSRVAALVEDAHALIHSAPEPPLEELERTFTIRTEDSFVVFVNKINELLQERAPKVMLRFILRTSIDAEALRDGLVHLDIGEIKTKSPEIKMQMLFRSGAIGAARADHPLFRGKITAKRFASYRHVNASRAEGEIYTPIDAELKKLGLKRTISLVVPSFGTALLAVANSQMLTTIPRHLGNSAKAFGLRVFEIPVPVRPVKIFQAWHPRLDADPAHRFLRECVQKACHSFSRQNM
jgi:DNA-binding transcriptional LysR family regulator